MILFTTIAVLKRPIQTSRHLCSCLHRRADHREPIAGALSSSRDKAFKMAYGLADDRRTVAAADPNLLKSGQPLGTRTHGPRLKSTSTLEKNQLDQSSEVSDD